MRIKEQALISAVDRLGPSWSPSHPLLLGPWVVFLLSIFGAVLGLFQAAGRGGRTWLELYAPMQMGIYLSFFIAAVSFLIVLFEAARGEGEMETAFPFAVSGLVSMVVIALCDAVFGSSIQEAMRDWPPLVGTR